MVRTVPFARPAVAMVSSRSTRTWTGWDRNFTVRLRSMAPGRRPASCRIWKPLQIPRTGPPFLANSPTARITGLKRAIAPVRR